MQLHVAYDAQGRILTAVLLVSAGSAPTLSIGPKQGTEIADLDIPKEFEGKPLSDFVHLLRVDVKAKRLVAGTKG
jgi:hypothetical protein